MQSGCRCGGRAFDFAVDGLVSFLVLQLLFYVRRKRHIAHSVENVLEHAVKLKLYRARAVLAYLRNDCAEFVAKVDNRA